MSKPKFILPDQYATKSQRYDELLEEAIGFNKLLADPRAQTAMQNFMERGGQTSDGEKRLGELAGELG